MKMSLRKNMRRTLKRQNKLSKVLSLPALDGNISLLVSSGVFTLKTAPLFAVSIIAGPSALVIAANLGGTMRENVFAALLAGLIAMGLIIFAAAIGSHLQNWVNMNVLQVFGGVALITIGLSLIGVKIPEELPVFLILVGFILAFLKN